LDTGGSGCHGGSALCAHAHLRALDTRVFAVARGLQKGWEEREVGAGGGGGPVGGGEAAGVGGAFEEFLRGRGYSGKW
jgi:hypothetical protein